MALAERRETRLAEDLFTEHSRRVYAYCLHRLGSPEEAEDALQATYLNACRSLMRGFEPDEAQAWLLTVAHNVCVTRLRSKSRRSLFERPQDIQAMQDFVAAPEGSDDELLGLEDALAVLPEQQRRAILLREWHGLSYREVAVELGLTQSAVEALIFRARRSLARALETVAPRPRLVHAFHPAALLGSLKSALSGSLATGVAVAASATVIAAGPIVADSAPKVFAEPEPAAVDRMADVPRLVVGLSAAGAESGRGHARAGKGEERNGPPPWAHGGSEAKPEKASPPSWGKGGSPAASASKGKKG